MIASIRFGRFSWREPELAEGTNGCAWVRRGAKLELGCRSGSFAPTALARAQAPQPRGQLRRGVWRLGQSSAARRTVGGEQLCQLSRSESQFSTGRRGAMASRPVSARPRTAVSEYQGGEGVRTRSMAAQALAKRTSEEDFSVRGAPPRLLPALPHAPWHEVSVGSSFPRVLPARELCRGLTT